MQEACIALSIDHATLYRWLIRAQIEPKCDTVDKRKRVLTLAQVQELARLHNRVLHDIPSNAVMQSAMQDILQNALQNYNERIAELEKRIAELERLVQKQPALLRPAPATYETARPASLRPTRLVHNGGQLPDGLVGFRQFAELHNMAQSTGQRAIESGRLEVVRGKWKVGRAWVEMALDQLGRRKFFDLFFENPGFKACPQCPHNV